MKNNLYTTKSTTSLSRWILLTSCVILCLFAVSVNAQVISSTTYPFSTSTGATLEDLSTGASSLVGSASDDGASTVRDIGFDFWYMGAKQSQFSANANGLLRLGSTVVGGTFTNVLANTTDAPKIAPYFDDLATGTTGDVRYKVIGSAPNRKLVVQWFVTVPRNTAGAANATFQCWLYESTGVIEFVYGNGMLVNTINTGASIGLATTATNFASITVSTLSCSYVSSVDTNTRVIASGSKFTFTPLIPSDPSGLNFTSITQTGMTLNWTDNSSNEVGFAIYRSSDGGATYSFVSQAAANAVTSAQTGLIAGSTYLWKVYAVTEGGLSANAATGTQATSAAGSITSTGAGGNWSNTATWVGGVLPTAFDDVTIADGATVTIDVTTAVCNNLTVGQGASGILNWIAGAVVATLTVSNDVTVASGGSFTTAGATGSSAKTLNIGGTTAAGSATSNLIVNGSFDMANSATAFASTFFFGSGNSSISGGGATANFYAITVNKGTNQTNATLEATRVITILAPTSNTPSRLVLTAGTFKVSSATTATPYFGSQTICAAAARLWLNNASASLSCVGTGTSATGAGSPTVTGELRIDNGTFGYGQGNNTLTFTSGSGVLRMSGGTLNIYGAIAFPSNAGTLFSMSGGNINVDPQNIASLAAGTALFSIGALTSVSWSGGVVTLVDPHSVVAGLAWSATAGGTKLVTGGTVRIGDGTSTTVTAAGNTGGFGIISGMAIWKLEINNRTNASTTRFARLTGSTTVLNQVELKANSYLFLGSGTTSATLFLNGNLINEGILAGQEPGGAQFLGAIQCGAAVGQSVTGTAGTFVNLGTLSMANTSTGLTLSQTNQFNVQRVNFFFVGGITNANKLTLGLGSTSFGAVQYGQAGGVVVAGTFDVAPSFNIGTGGTSLLYVQESASRTMGVEVPPSRIISNLTINNTNGVILAGGAITDSTLLTLTAGNLTTTAANLLTISKAATTGISGGGTASFVNGPIARALPASLVSGSTYTFPVGKGSYRPFELVNPTTTAGGTVTAQAEVFDVGSGGSGTGTILSINTNRYWAASITAGAGNFTNTLIRLNDTTGLSTGLADAVAGSATLTGGYNLIGGLAPTVGVSSVTTVAPAATTLLGFYALGLRNTPQLSNLIVTPSGDQCTSSSRAVSIDVQPGSALIDSVVIVYSVVGGSSNVRLSMANSTGNGGLLLDTWTSTIPAPTPVTGLVTWTVTAYDHATFAKVLTGPSFKDGRTSTFPITIVPGTASFCASGGGTNITSLTAVSSQSYTYTWTSLDAATIVSTGPTSVDASLTVTSAFRVVGTSGLCTDSAFISIGVYDFPVSTPVGPQTICLGDSAILSSGLSASNFAVAPITYGLIPIPATAGTGPVGDDVVSGDIPIGFTYNFFGNNYTTFRISTNGNIQFGPTYSTSFTPGSLPNGTVTNFIALAWSDLLVAGGTANTTGVIKYFTTGYAPNRKCVVDFSGCSMYNAGASVGNMGGQIVIYETTGVVDINLTESTALASTGGGAKTLGVNNNNGSIGAAAPGRNGTAWITTVAEAWRFSPPQTYSVSYTSSPVNQFGAGATSGSNLFQVYMKPTSLGLKTYSITFSNGTCSNAASPATFNLTAIDKPTKAVITADSINICGTQTVTLGINNAGSLASTDTAYWFANALNGTPVHTGNANWTLSVGATTKYYVRTWNGTCFYNGAADDSISVIFKTPPAITATNNGPICPGTAAGLNATSSANYSYTWQPGSLSGASPSSGTLFAQTTFTVTGTDNIIGDVDSGCVATATTTVTLKPTPNSVDATADQYFICNPGGTNLHAVAQSVLTPLTPTTANFSLSNPTTDEDNGTTGTAGFICPGNNTIGSFTLPVLPAGSVYKSGRLVITGYSSSFATEVQLHFSGPGIIGSSACFAGTVTGTSPYNWTTADADTAAVAALLNPAGGAVNIEYSESYNDNTTGPDATFPATADFNAYYLDPASGPVYNYSWSPALHLSSTTTANTTASGVTEPSITYTVTASLLDGSCPAQDSVTLSSIPLAVSISGPPPTAGLFGFTNTTAAFTPLSGATTVAATNASTDDGITASIPLGFTFLNTFTTFKMNTNGWITFNPASLSTTQYTVLSSADVFAVAAFNRDLVTTDMSYLLDVSGGIGNYIMKIQWDGVHSFSSGVVPETGTFQVWLYESTGVVEIRYGAFTEGARTTAGTVQAGLKGASTAPADILAVTGSTFSGAAASSISTNSLPVAVGNLPDNGRLFRFTPPGSTPVICSGDSIILTATVSGGGTPYGSYAWSDGTTTTYPSTPTIKVSPPVGTTNFTVSVTDACPATVTSASLPVVVNPVPVITVTPNAVNIGCSSSVSTALLTATGAGGYSWSPATGLYATTYDTAYAHPTTTTVYTVSGVALGCTAIGTATVTVNPLVSLSVTATPNQVCNPGTSALLATASVPTGPTGYCETGLGGACTSWLDTVTFNTLSNTQASCGTLYLAFPQAGTTTTTVLQGNTYPIYVATAVGTNGIVSVWIDYNQNGSFEASEWTQVYTNDVNGTANITIPGGALNGTTRMRVRSRSTLNPNGSGDACLSFGSGTTHDYLITIGTPATPPSFTYAWTPPTHLSSTSVANPTASGITEDTIWYHVTVTQTVAGGGCSTTDSVMITSNPLSAVVIAGPVAPMTAYYSLTSASLPYSSLVGFGGINTIDEETGLTIGFSDETQDDGGLLVTLPFSFDYKGASYTQMSMSTNGWVAVGDQSAITAGPDRTPGNLFTNSIPNNTLAPWFRDMGANLGFSGGFPGTMNHGLIATDVYAFQWDQAVGSGFSNTTTNLVSFEVDIYGPASSNPGRIVYIYGPQAGASFSTGASIGIEDATGGTGHYLNALNGTSTTTSTATAWPGNGSAYIFDPIPGTPSVSLCTNDSTLLTSTITGGGSPYTYLWSTGATTATTYVHPSAGTNNYTLTVTDNCTSSLGSNTVTITGIAIPDVQVTAGVSTQICGSGTVDLHATGGTTYTWTPTTALTPTNTADVNASPTASTFYIVTGTTAGCSDTAGILVKYSVVPVIDSVTATGDVYSGCNPFSTQLNAYTTYPVLAYSVTPITGQTYTQLNGGGITVISQATDLLTGFSTGSQDDGGVLVSLPFNFDYAGTSFSQMSFSTNGWVAAGDISTITAGPDRTPGNLFINTLPNNTLAAWFKDMGANFGTGFPGTMRHGLIGTDVYAFQWDQAVGSSFSNTTTTLISFQINIYGPASSNPGRIEYIYGPTLGTISFAASIGIEDAIGGTGHYVNALNGLSTSTTTSTAWPGNGNGYRFDPASVLNYAWSPSNFLSSTTVPNPNVTGLTNDTTYTVIVSNAVGCADTGTVRLTVTNCGGVVLNLNVFLEGYYQSPGSSTPMEYQYSGFGMLGIDAFIEFVANVPDDVDTMIVSLVDSTILSNTFDVATATIETQTGIVKTNGVLQLNFSGSAIGSTSYVRVQNNRHIEIWSATPIVVSASSSYDLTADSTSAYAFSFGNPFPALKEMEPGKWAMYTGEQDADQAVTIFDIPILIGQFESGTAVGYFSGDLDGSCDVTIFDIPLMNANLEYLGIGVYAQQPPY